MQPMDFPAFVDRCVFIDGEAYYHAPNCAHMRAEDEEGDILPPGWTVQGG